jgi:serine/threonine protein kinase/Tol biopolymer transport system component/tetratricopeptide (TPR) repeat protein
MNDLQRIKPIFEQALDLEGDNRRVYLDEACGDPDLRNKIEALLRAHEGAHGFLESPALEAQVSLDESPLSEGPGTVIGRYKLLEKIGEGGMAVVYMAEQEQPIRRKVALKIIKLGMDTHQVIARFEAERQALAMMDHPCIAKVLDAGSTETGRPYFVMELVQGVSITEYCDKNSLSTKDRLGLFLQVCNAVQHAHTKGIIHRDLKPSNVMVTCHDGKPVPKVIDFGIAKAINQKLTEKTLFTRYAHLIGTPAYMSPEQAELNDLDIDTRSDIYSLGVLLYELLTGTTPFSKEELRKAGYTEMQRIIREQEPIKPSTRIRTALRGANVPARPGTDRTPVAPMGKMPMLREIKGDLDWIVMKSLEKDRTRRYETASGLAEDIHRHLESEPVLARDPGAAYRLRKFLRRNRAQVFAVLATVVVAGAVLVSLSLWRQERLQTEEWRHKVILDQARDQYAKGERQAVLETVKPIFRSPYVGPDAQLLCAMILAEDRRSEEAIALLDPLVHERRDIAGAAYALWARILCETQSANAEKSAEIEEYQRQAEALLPKTAQAYFSRAMTAVTIKEQLDFLDEALRLASQDPDPRSPINYESRRLRAFIYYASRMYEKMRDDAFAMTILRPRDPLGYSLRAMALRELGQYAEAIAAYDDAMAPTQKNDPQYLDLTTQRLETLLRMRSYQPAVAAAQEASGLWPDHPTFQYDLFVALTALGDYESAVGVFERIISPGPEARRAFEDWCTRYMFDSLQAGRPWHLPDHAPVGMAFLPLVEAEETYRHLAAKAKRVIVDGFTGRWSPDGKKLVFSMGVVGYNGVALYDPATHETELLIVPGKDPAWSPDGRYIAFVRECQALQVPEFATAGRKAKVRPNVEEEVWIMKADGTQPRRLARGGWPSWSQDSRYVYYQSRVDNVLCSISIEDRDATADRITACSYPHPSISPDGQRMAYVEAGLLKVKDLATQRIVAQSTASAPAWGFPAWSPTGSELCTGGTGNKMGLWVHRLDGSEPLKILDSQITEASWAPDGTKLVFHLGAPYFEIWTADLDPKASLAEAMGPAQTIDDYSRSRVALHTRRIQTDPQDVSAYADRARCYDDLHEQLRAQIDMKRWSAVMSGKSPSGLWFGTPRDLGCILDLPFDSELVFSAERPVHTLSMMSVAFGQKGRSEMKRFEIPMVVMSFFGLGLLSGLDTPVAQANFTFGEPTKLGPTISTSEVDAMPCSSPDGLELYFNHGPTDATADIWVSRRATPDSPWGPSSNLGPVVNSPGGNGPGSMSADGLSLYLFSTRSGGFGSYDIWVTTRLTVQDDWGVPTNLGPVVNTGFRDQDPLISPDGLELYFTSDRPGGFGGRDLWVTKRVTVSDAWGAPTNVGATVNSPSDEWYSAISPDGLLLILTSNRPGGCGSGGALGLYDLYMTRRATKNDPWDAPVNLGPIVNGPSWDSCPNISADGSTLYFARVTNLATYDCDIWQAPILPTVDFNGDGKVDAADMAILEANWGQNEPLCDIGPFPWGDGVVDEKDLAVFMEWSTTPGSEASDVPFDVVLSWMGPSFAESYDVYLGTSLDDISNATREDPCGVLVSEGQTETTYNPEGLLEFSRTYYWRVDVIDVVVGASEPVIYKGPAFSFTTEAFAYPIQNITATASSRERGMGPENTVNGSGLDENDGHSTESNEMWLSKNAGPHWIQYEFDQVYALNELWVWNSNQALEPFMGFGAKTVKIEYSTDGANWTVLEGVPEFARASGQAGYLHNTVVSFGGISAKYVKLTIEKGWGIAPTVGLSEVRFFYIPDRSSTQP